MALKLLYRSTFIHVEDDSSVVPMKLRSQSQPPCTRNVAAFADARLEEFQLSEYVATLGVRSGQLDVLIRSNGSAKAKEQQCLGIETASTASPGSSLKNFGGHRRTTSSLSSISSTSPVNDAESDMGKLLPPSQGSIGHPEVCRRPCIYFARGDCQNGSACGYCHLDHAGRGFHLDKWNRDMLKKMPFVDVLSLVLKLARKRALDSGILSEAGGVVQVLENWSLTQLPAKTFGTLEVRRLYLAMQNVPFSGLIMFVLKKHRSDMSQADADFAEQLQGALVQMGK